MPIFKDAVCESCGRMNPWNPECDTHVLKKPEVKAKPRRKLKFSVESVASWCWDNADVMRLAYPPMYVKPSCCEEADGMLPDISFKRAKLSCWYEDDEAYGMLPDIPVPMAPVDITGPPSNVV